MKQSRIIDCLRSRYLGVLTVRAECAPEPSDCRSSTQRKPCEQLLAEKRAALQQLSAGAAVQEISEGDRRVRYFHSQYSMQCLKEEIDELQMQCGGAAGGSVIGCDPCSGTAVFDTFERVRPPPIQINTRRW